MKNFKLETAEQRSTGSNFFNYMFIINFNEEDELKVEDIITRKLKGECLVTENNFDDTMSMWFSVDNVWRTKREALKDVRIWIKEEW